MKKTIFILSILLYSVLHISAADKKSIVKKVEANPVNIAVVLTQEPDTAEMASICEYYGYIRQNPKDGYTVFTHANGSIIRYGYSSDGEKYPTIELKSKVSQNEKHRILQNLNFQKVGNIYERRSIGYITRCNPESQGYIKFTSQPKHEN